MGDSNVPSLYFHSASVLVVEIKHVQWCFSEYDFFSFEIWVNWDIFVIPLCQLWEFCYKIRCHFSSFQIELSRAQKKEKDVGFEKERWGIFSLTFSFFFPSRFLFCLWGKMEKLAFSEDNSKQRDFERTSVESILGRTTDTFLCFKSFYANISF